MIFSRNTTPAPAALQGKGLKSTTATANQRAYRRRSDEKRAVFVGAKEPAIAEGTRTTQMRRGGVDCRTSTCTPAGLAAAREAPSREGKARPRRGCETFVRVVSAAPKKNTDPSKTHTESWRMFVMKTRPSGLLGPGGDGGWSRL